ncbi:hypothetical protein C4J81_16400 [Deltaproteobacteria bacterium Smac51]|nr:hypothetical protein C4J81_16400 [Deltaproteobacteria bacterium Smac51]
MTEQREKTKTIDLEFPIQLADRLLEQVIMTRPTMGQLKKNRPKGQEDLESEMRLFCSLTRLKMEEIEMLDYDDYTRLQDAYTSFRRSTE